MVTHLSTCCFVCSLKTGSIIIASISLFYSVIFLMMASRVLHDPHAEVKNILDEDKPKTPEFLFPFLEIVTTTQSPEEIELRENAAKLITDVYIAAIAITALEMIVDLLLIFGAGTERPRLVKTWIVYNMIALVLVAILRVANIVLERSTGKTDAEDLIGLFIGIPLHIYQLIVVNSFHTELLINNLPVAPKLV